MGARRKLNSGAIAGSLILACGLGYMTGSALVFFVAAVIMVALSYYSGDIR